MVITESVILMAAPEGVFEQNTSHWVTHVPQDEDGSRSRFDHHRFFSWRVQCQNRHLCRRGPKTAASYRIIHFTALELDPYVRSARRKREETRLVSGERNARHRPTRLAGKSIRHAHQQASDLLRIKIVDHLSSVFAKLDT